MSPAISKAATARTRVLRFRPPEPEPRGEPFLHEFFAGFWHPDGSVRVQAEFPDSIPHRTMSGANWVLFSSRASIHPGEPGLIHGGADPNTAVAFRGYLLDPPLHAYSNTSAIARFPWTSATRLNGVFATASLAADSLVLTTDALGLSPLYYRHIHGGLAFATSTRYLKMESDGADMLAWRLMLHSGYLSNDRTLLRSIRRVPAGCRLVMGRRGLLRSVWFDHSSLPDGARNLDEAALAEIEACFQRAMERCLNLTDFPVLLPLSSGHDSRRILAALRWRGVDFEAMTARVYQKEHRDLDAVYAMAMARDMGFRHRVIEPAPMDQYRRDDEFRCALVDGETQNHTWAIRFFKAFPQKPCLVFDGLLGDILANPGFRLEGLYVSPESDIELITRHCVGDQLEKLLRPRAWPEIEAVREEVRDQLRRIELRDNRAVVAFILLQSRIMTAPWSQQLLPSGHVVVCPYADLEYLQLLLEFSPAEKHQRVVQRLCLQKFWPEYARYPGNRDIPESVPPGSPSRFHEENQVRVDRLLSTAQERGFHSELMQLLNPVARARALACRASRWVLQRSAWYLIPLLEMLDRTQADRASWF
jgi:hypothetical protein